MRILQIHTRYRQAGGEDTVADAEAALLRDAGHDVVRLLGRNPGGAVAAAAALSAAPWNARAARRAQQLVTANRPDVAHVHNTWFALSPAVVTALHRQGVPIVLTLHNYRLMCANSLLLRDGAPCNLCVGSHPWHGVRHRCYRGSAAASAAAAATIALHRQAGTWDEQVTRMLAPSAFVRDRHLAGGFPADKVVLHPNFTADPGARREPPGRAATVVYAGRLAPEKGVAGLVEAWSRRPPAGLELLIVGDGPLRSQLEQAAVPTIRVVGALPRPRVSRLLGEARAVIQPAVWYENQPLVVLEAFAAGTPVLASRLGGLEELVAPLGARWLAPPGNPDAWVEALAGLGDDAAVDHAGRVARTAYEQSHTPAAALRRLETCYHGIGA